MYTFDENIVSDLHKDAYGFRPSEYFYEKWHASSDDQKQEIWDNLVEALELHRALEHAQLEARIAYEKATVEFEEDIAENIKLGAGDRATAIRWLIEALDAFHGNGEYDLGYFCYLRGLPYSMTSKLDECLKAA